METKKTITIGLQMAVRGMMSCLLFGRLWDAIAEAESINGIIENVNASPWHEDILWSYDLDTQDGEIYIYQRVRPANERFLLMIVRFETVT